MTLIADLGSAGLIWLLTIAWGATVAGWLFGPGRFGLRSRVCIGSMIGMGLMSWCGLLCSLAGITFASRWPLALSVVLAIATFVVGYRRGAWKYSARLSATPETPMVRVMNWTIAAACFVSIAAIFVFGQTQPLGNIDGLAIWDFKAKILLEQSLATTTILHDPTFSYCHLSYPLLVPFQIAFVWSLRGLPTDGASAAWHAILATLFVVFVYDICRMKLSRLASLMLTLSVCSMRSFLFQSTGHIADVVLMYASLASVATFLGATKEQKTGDWIVCGFCLAGLSFVKNEGGAFAGIELILLLGLVLIRQVPWKQAAACFCSFVIPNIPWWIYSRGLPKTDERYTEHLTWQNLLNQSERLPTILSSAARYMTDLATTRGLWLLVGIAIIVAVVRRRTRAVWLAFAILAGQLLAYTVAFVITPWNLETLIAMKMEVILLTLMPAVLVCLIEVFEGTRGFSSVPSTDISNTAVTTQKAASKSAKGKRQGHGPSLGDDWRRGILLMAFVLMAFLSLPNLFIALPPVLMARLNGKQPLPVEVRVRQELQRLFAQVKSPGDIRFSYPAATGGGTTPDVMRFAEMLYYFGNYELFPRKLRATADRVVINNGFELLQAMADSSATWPEEFPMAATLEVKSQPQRAPELVLTPTPSTDQPSEK